MTMQPYNVLDHYWTVEGKLGYWSSKNRQYVADLPYQGFPVTKIKNEEELRQVFVSAGCEDRGPNYVPSSVYLWQAKAILAQTGHLENANQAIQNSNNALLIQAWDYAPFISRNSPAVSTIGAILNLTSEQIDQLFRDANNIVV